MTTSPTTFKAVLKPFFPYVTNAGDVSIPSENLLLVKHFVNFTLTIVFNYDNISLHAVV